MKKHQDLNVKCDIFSAERLEDVLMMHFKENMLFRAADLDARDTVLDYLDLVSRDGSIKVIVMISSPNKTGRREYLEFFHQLEHEADLNMVMRMCNVVNKFILKIVGLNKIVVHANSGRVISLFLNVSLACDYRIVADNTIFQNPYLELGLVPKGGGPFLLSRKLGLSKAYEILLFQRDITAYEALSLGIVDSIVALNKLEDAALKVARRFAKQPSDTLSGVKRLLNYPIEDLEGYLEFENHELLRLVRPHLWK